MCGIVGHCCRSGKASLTGVRAGIDSLRHRGPDDFGEWVSPQKNVILGHSRLSIIDLSQKGRQPIFDPKGNCAISFNGEIYNYKNLKLKLEGLGYEFVSNTDSEVLLKSYVQWGTKLLDKIIGMFSFCIYDKKQNIVFFARDRAGEKPFFYHANENEIIFASELTALIKTKRLTNSLCNEQLYNYFTVGYFSTNQSILSGIKKLEPGHGLVFDLNNGKWKKWRYWQLPNFDLASTYQSDEALTYELGSLISKSVSLQLQADVKTGILLSGGLDSSLICGIAANLSSNINTFTVSMGKDSKLDESNHAETIANYFGTNHHVIEAADIDSHFIYNVFSNMDEPLADLSLLPTYMLMSYVKKNCKVVLGGDGSDEIFAGYHHYINYPRQLANEFYIPKFVRHNIGNMVGKTISLSIPGRNYIMRLLGTNFQRFPNTEALFDKFNYNKLFKEPNIKPCEGLYENVDALSHDDKIQQLLKYDFSNYLPSDILVKTDRASMQNSLELRSPFLDKSIIEFAYSRVPVGLKIKNDIKKYILKSVARKYLPKSFNYERKQGFSICGNSLLKEKAIINAVKEVVLDDSSIFSKKYFNSLLNGNKIYKKNADRIFSIYAFECWRQANRIRV